nr:hypothetical protein [Tanacetum cinerariifolium]
MLLAKQDEAGVILTDEQNDFLFADASRMEEIEDLSANICLMARIQPTNHSFDVGPSYIMLSCIGDDQIDSNIIFDTPNGNQLKHGLGYSNPYTLKQAISQCPKLYLASSLGNSEISLKVRDNEDTLDDASKSQQKMKEKLNDPFAVVNKQNYWTVDYPQINALYKDFVPQKELSAEQKYFPSSFIQSDKNSNATASIPESMPTITGYGDYIQSNITIYHVYYVEGDDLLTGGHESYLYTISISNMAASSPVCLMSKETLTKLWLWHRRLSHLNFDTIKDLTRLDLVDGLLKFKYKKDHLCSACERGKSKKASHPPKLVSSDNSKLELLHMDICCPMRVASIKVYSCVVDDYSRYTWVYFFHSKDETLEIIKKFIAQAQLNYKANVCKIRTDNGTEFKNATLKAHYEKLRIMQQFSTTHTPQQNGVVERRNRTLVEAARTMLIFSRLPEFL